MANLTAEKPLSGVKNHSNILKSQFQIDSRLLPDVITWQEESGFSIRNDYKKITVYKHRSSEYSDNEKPKKLVIIVDDILKNLSPQAFTDQLEHQLTNEQQADIIFLKNHINQNGNLSSVQDLISKPDFLFFYFRQTVSDLSNVIKHLSYQYKGIPIYVFGYNSGALVSLAFMYESFVYHRFFSKMPYITSPRRLLRFWQIQTRLFFVGGSNHHNMLKNANLTITEYGAHMRNHLKNYVSSLSDNKPPSDKSDDFLRLFENLFLCPNGDLKMSRLANNTRVLLGNRYDFENLEWLASATIKMNNCLNVFKTKELDVDGIEQSNGHFRCLTY